MCLEPGKTLTRTKGVNMKETQARNHELKTKAHYFEAIWNGSENFKIRDNSDRDFQAGDTVELVEHGRTEKGDPYSFSCFSPGEPTGRRIKATISYVTEFSQKKGMVVLALRDLSRTEAEKTE